MMKKAILFAVVLLVLATANAYAVPVTINVDELYDWGRLYTYASGVYTPANTDTSIGGSNPAGGYTIAENTFGVADGAEDSWGIGSIDTIKTLPGNAIVYARGSSELTLMFYGFDDNFISQPIIGTTSILGSAGGHVSVYLDSTSPDFDGTLGTAGRTGLSSYTGVTDGDSILVLDLAPVVNSNGFTLSSTSDLATGSGSGAMLLSVTGAGLWDEMYNTNTQLYGSDFSFTFTARDNSNPSVGDWIVRGDAGGEGNVVPEPASMILMGLGLLGAARLRRRKA
jgi:hypothetical protein